MEKLLRSAVATAILAGAALSAQAGLVGSTVNVKYFSPDLSTQFCNGGNQTVSAVAVEYPQLCPSSLNFALAIDFFDSSFTVSYGGAGFTADTFNGFVVDVVSGADFSTVKFVSEGSTLGVTSSSVVGGDLQINFAGQRGTGGTTIANFSFTQASAVPVPEPASLGLVGLALAALGVMRRRRAA